MMGRFLRFADWTIEEGVWDRRTHCGVPVPAIDAPASEWKAFDDEVVARLDREALLQHDYD